MPLSPLGKFGLQVALKYGPKLFKNKPKRYLSGDINVQDMTVDVCRMNPKYCRKSPWRGKLYNERLTAYLRGGPDPGLKRDDYLLNIIDQVKEQMRLRPLTPTESVAWGQMTPASKTLGAMLNGRGRAGPRRRRRTKKKRVARRRAVRSVRRGRRGRRARLVKGSAAAKRYMASIRRKRRA